MIFQKQKTINPLLSDMPLFAEVARLRSFSKAADALNLGVSTISRRVRLLEEKLGMPLLIRDTHSVQLTEEGKALLEHCEFIMNSADTALESITGRAARPSGRVRVSMYADIYYGSMQGALSSFADKWPDIGLSIRLAEDPPDLLLEPYDIIFRIGPLPHAHLTAKKVSTICPAAYAAPKLLEKHFKPEHPQDLRNLPCIALSRFGPVWELRCGSDIEVVHTAPKFTFSSALLVKEFAVGGHGIALIRDELAEPLVEKGELVRLLPKWKGPEHDLFLVMAGKPIPQRVQLLTSHMLSHLSSPSGNMAKGKSVSG
ncbi:MAG: LysR family transcriptional regulator [Deltaproteobacteria bacterium]|jgi:DNA-binding transcriptional LysR family regulator|nr:LysR family transcriptional regulator [Deltaproteobacteria bacterium]